MRAPHSIFAAVVAMSLAAASGARAQHEGHQMPAATAQAVPNPDCAQAGQRALVIVETAGLRVEAARRPNSGADLQDTIASAQRAVAAAQAELFTCRAAVPAASAGTTLPAAMAGMDHSTMNMGTPAPGARTAGSGAKPPDAMAGMDHSKMNTGKPAAGAKTAAPGAKPADPMAGMDHSKMDMGKPAASAKTRAPGAKPVDAMAGMDHSKMNMGKPAAGAKTATPGAKPSGAMAGMDHSKMNMGTPASGAKPAAPGAKPADPMAGMDHSKMAMAGAEAKPGDMPLAAAGDAKLPVMMAERIADPACVGNVGQATAPKAVLERKVYYFCSTAARDEFRKDPAAYLKKHPR